ncbi:MAG: hypothetical protein HWE30_08055 [Methylocystaceae bacterium]|nr:hypothetical protein [Methylocystaceae bacterium]
MSVLKEVESKVVDFKERTLDHELAREMTKRHIGKPRSADRDTYDRVYHVLLPAIKENVNRTILQVVFSKGEYDCSIYKIPQKKGQKQVKITDEITVWLRDLTVLAHSGNITRVERRKIIQSCSMVILSVLNGLPLEEILISEV